MYISRSVRIKRDVWILLLDYIIRRFGRVHRKIGVALTEILSWYLDKHWNSPKPIREDFVKRFARSVRVVTTFPKDLVDRLYEYREKLQSIVGVTSDYGFIKAIVEDAIREYFEEVVKGEAVEASSVREGENTV